MLKFQWRAKIRQTFPATLSSASRFPRAQSALCVDIHPKIKSSSHVTHRSKSFSINKFFSFLFFPFFPFFLFFFSQTSGTSNGTGTTDEKVKTRGIFVYVKIQKYFFLFFLLFFLSFLPSFLLSLLFIPIPKEFSRILVSIYREIR